MPALSYPASQRTPLLAQLLTAFVGGIILFFGAIFLWTLGYQLIYAGRIFPGISVAGVDLSGMSPQDAALKLSQTLSYPISGKVLFRDGSNVWVASPAQLGMVFDPSSSAESAYRLGRSGDVFAALDGQLRALEFGDEVAPVIVFDQRVANQYLQMLAQKVNQPAVEAGLHLEWNKCGCASRPDRARAQRGSHADLSGCAIANIHGRRSSARDSGNAALSRGCFVAG